MNFISRVLIKPIRYQSQQVFLFCKTDQKVYKVYAEKAMQMISDLSE